MKRKSNVLALLLGAVAFVAAVLALTVTPAARATDPVTFTDPSGDAGGAPDVTSATVTERDGIFKVVLDATAVKTMDGYTEVDVVFNSDQNAATGDEIGIDHYFAFGYDQGELYATFFHWVGGQFVAMDEGPDMSFDPGADTYTVLFNATDFGITSGFDFFVVTGGYDSGGQSLGEDDAPALSDSGAFTFWTFHVAPSPWSVAGALVGQSSDGTVYVVGDDGLLHYIDAATFAAKGLDWNAVSWFGTLPGTVGAPVPAVAPAAAPAAVPRAPESVTVAVPAIGVGVSTPSTVLAGKSVVLRFPVTDVATGAPLTTVSMMASNPKINGTIVKHVEKFVDGVATITLKVPKTATGKSLQVALKIKSGEQLASKTQTFRIR